MLMSSDHEHHSHRQHRPAEGRTRLVVFLSLATMLLELGVGYWSQSVALQADGWHMGTHVGAFGVAWAAYAYGRSTAGVKNFVFGPGKLFALAGYTNALILAGVAVSMGIESVRRMLTPGQVAYPEALVVAVVGLIVNLISARALGVTVGHGHDHADGHDHNLRAVYLHILADAVTSVLAIVALVAGWLWGLGFLDPAMGMVGAIVILWWAVGLWKQTASELVDLARRPQAFDEIKTRIADDFGAELVDLRIWSVGQGRDICLARVRAVGPHPPGCFRDAIAKVGRFSEIFVDVDPGY